jgi:DDE superfamily endonuclease
MVIFSGSGIEEDLAARIHIGGIQYCIYGDSPYALREYLMVGYDRTGINPEQATFNKAMSRSRVTAEWIFKNIKKYWNHAAYPRKLALCMTPVGVLYGQALVFGTSAAACMNRLPHASSRAHLQL